MTESKLNSRKFIVWIAATIFELASLVYAFAAKDSSIAQQFTSWWGWISALYIGANVAQKFSPQTVLKAAEEAAAEDQK